MHREFRYDRRACPCFRFAEQPHISVIGEVVGQDLHFHFDLAAVIACARDCDLCRSGVDIVQAGDRVVEIPAPRSLAAEQNLRDDRTAVVDERFIRQTEHVFRQLHRQDLIRCHECAGVVSDEVRGDFCGARVDHIAVCKVEIRVHAFAADDGSDRRDMLFSVIYSRVIFEHEFAVLLRDGKRLDLEAELQLAGVVARTADRDQCSARVQILLIGEREIFVLGECCLAVRGLHADLRRDLLACEHKRTFLSKRRGECGIVRNAERQNAEAARERAGVGAGAADRDPRRARVHILFVGDSVILICAQDAFAVRHDQIRRLFLSGVIGFRGFIELRIREGERAF